MIETVKRLAVVTAVSAVAIIAIKVITFQNDNLTIAHNKDCGLRIEACMDSDTNTLKCDVDNVCVNSINGNMVCIDKIKEVQWIKRDLDLKSDRYTINNKVRTIAKELELNAFKFNDRLAYIQYANSDMTGNKEIMLTSSKVDKVGMTKVNARIDELKNQIQNKLMARSYDQTQLVLSEAITGGKLNSSDLMPELVNIEDNMYFGDSSKYKLNIQLEDLGEINVNELSGYIGSIEITYLKGDGVLRIADAERNKPCVYISSINTGVFDYTPSEFRPTEIDNFYESNRNDDDSREFSTFAFIGGKNFYVIKVVRTMDDVIINNILVQLGLKEPAQLIEKTAQLASEVGSIKLAR